MTKNNQPARTPFPKENCNHQPPIKINKILQDKKDNQQFLKLIAPKYMGVYVVDLKKISSVIL